MTTITKAEWEAKGVELFGEDRATWSFHCPRCENDMSIERARNEFSELKGCGWQPESECIGRYTDRVDCDWCAYGLFHGPVLVAVEGEEKPVPIFDFAGQPFTKKELPGGSR